MNDEDTNGVANWWEFYTITCCMTKVVCGACAKVIKDKNDLVVADGSKSIGKIRPYCVTCATFMGNDWKP